MAGQPGGKGLGGPIAKQIDRTASLQIAEDGAIPLTFPECPIVHAQHTHVSFGRFFGRLDTPKDGRSACRYVEFRGEPSSWPAAERESEHLQRIEMEFGRPGVPPR